MDIRERAALFSQYVGLELKGKITARGFTAKNVAAQAGHSASALNKWLNGKTKLPMAVLCEACEIIGADPGDIIDSAYDRLRDELGGPSIRPGDVGGLLENGPMPLAAKKGRRKTEVDSAE
ncbi:MAG: helix-turn-helix domain-containing protein [Microbacterium sp.]